MNIQDSLDIILQAAFTETNIGDGKDEYRSAQHQTLQSDDGDRHAFLIAASGPEYGDVNHRKWKKHGQKRAHAVNISKRPLPTPSTTVIQDLCSVHDYRDHALLSAGFLGIDSRLTTHLRAWFPARKNLGLFRSSACREATLFVYLESYDTASPHTQVCTH